MSSWLQDSSFQTTLLWDSWEAFSYEKHRTNIHLNKWRWKTTFGSVKEAIVYFRGQNMMIFGRVIPLCAPNCPSYVLGREHWLHEPKKCWGAAKVSSKGSAGFSVHADISSLIHVSAAVGGYEYTWDIFCCCTKTWPVHGVIYIWQGFGYGTQAQNTIVDIHKASSEFITQQLLQQIIPISSQEKPLDCTCCKGEEFLEVHTVSKEMKTKKLILTWFITPFTSCNTSVVLCVVVWSLSPFSSKSPCF